MSDKIIQKVRRLRQSERDRIMKNGGRAVAWSELLDMNKEDRLLDIGSGFGYLDVYLEDLTGFTVGVDIDREALSYALSKCKNTHFILSSATCLPFKQRIFSNVICSDVIEHLLERTERQALSDV